MSISAGIDMDLIVTVNIGGIKQRVYRRTYLENAKIRTTKREVGDGDGDGDGKPVQHHCRHRARMFGLGVVFG